MQLNQVEPLAYRLTDDGVIPNNSRCPLLVYVGVLTLTDPEPARCFESVFSRNGWGASWRNGVFPFHHYHSTAHEVLGIYCGWAQVLLGGGQGVALRVREGDVVVIPAGVGHKKLDSGAGFACVGAYPVGQTPDLCRRRQAHAQSLANIAAVSLPDRDPVYGSNGPLFRHWQAV